MEYSILRKGNGHGESIAEWLSPTMGIVGVLQVGLTRIAHIWGRGFALDFWFRGFAPDEPSIGWCQWNQLLAVSCYQKGESQSTCTIGGDSLGMGEGEDQQSRKEDRPSGLHRESQDTWVG